MSMKAIELLLTLADDGDNYRVGVKLDRGQCTEILDELTTLREANRWIPVSERLPKDGEKVIIAECYGYITFATYAGSTLGWKTALGNFYSDSACSLITHWKPMPPLPKQDGEK